MVFSFETIQAIASKDQFIRKNYFYPKSSPLRYLRFRILRPLLKIKHQQMMKKWNDQPVPWMTPAAVDILHLILTPDLKGFEFGSGRSTLFIAARAGELTSLEHNEEWYTHIREELTKRNLAHVHYFLQPQQNDPAKTTAYPKNNYINYVMPRVPATCFTQYYTFIDQYPDEAFDFIIVDGRARVECTQHAIPKLKRGGLLILDNAERQRYVAIHTLLRNWKKVFTTSGITDTVFWFKP
jgi:predicted O-methyltransferase YrrM